MTIRDPFCDLRLFRNGSRLLPRAFQALGSGRDDVGFRFWPHSHIRPHRLASRSNPGGFFAS